MRKLTLIFILLLVTFQPILAATTGKITGQVTDYQSGQGIMGVNVIIEGEQMGAATDQNGYYSILNIPPGQYTVNFSRIGYAEAVYKDVQVKIGLTTEINVELRSEALGMEGLEVIASRPVVLQDVSNSRLDVDYDNIKNLPIKNVESIIGLQAGIDNDLEIRGSDPSQTAIILDGLDSNNPRSKTPYTNYSLSAVKEIQVQTGGFSAEYGDARAGVVNIITREGSPQKYSGMITYRHSPPSPKHFGPAIYSPNTYYTRPFTDPEVCWTGTASGAWDRYKQRQYVSFEGYNRISENLNNDDNPDNNLTPAGVKRLWEWRHRRKGTIDKPDYNIDMGFGGPVPFLSDELGNLRFFTSYVTNHEMFILPLYRDSYDDSNFMLKLTSDITNKAKLTLTQSYGSIQSVNVDQWGSAPTGDVVRTSYQIASLASQTYGDEIIYMPDYYTPTDINRNQTGLKLVYQMNEKEFLQLKLNRRANFYHTYAPEERDTTKQYDIFPNYQRDYMVDEAPYGYYPWSTETAPGGHLSLGGWMGFGRDSSTVNSYTLETDYTNQINRFHKIKTGFELTYTDYDIDASLYHPVSVQWNSRMKNNSAPIDFGAYIQDKLEFEGMIMNIGIRYDYSNVRRQWFELNPYDTLLTAAHGEQLEERAPKDKIDPVSVFSPRLGVSHPITEASKLYFNYCHFNSLPESRYRFQISRSGTDKIIDLGNPALPFAKTIQYELGYEHDILDQYLLKLAAYYKDISDQPSYTTYLNSDGSIQVDRVTSDSYENIRGFEFTLRKQAGEWIYGFINYTYMVQSSGYFGVRQQHENIIEQKIYEKNNPKIFQPNPRPYFRANLNFHSPQRFGRLLGDWNLNLLGNWKAGMIDTYNPENIPGITDNVQWKDYYNLDLRLSKNVDFKKVNMEIYLDVKNVFNTKHFSSTGFSDSYDRIDYMESLHFDWEEGIQQGDDRVGEYRDWSVDFVPMIATENVNEITNPESRALYYDKATETYMQFRNNEWVTRSKNWVQEEVIDTKAYIDMPNYKYFTFLNPRNITFGIKISF